MANIGRPTQDPDIVITPEREPVPEPFVIPDAPALPDPVTDPVQDPIKTPA